jgi:predicted nucleic acid-binding Zn finger protein
MFDNNDADNESIDLEPRTRRALEEPLTVLTTDLKPVDEDEDTSIVTVTSHSGSEYTVDVREGRCTCPDQKHREPEGGCKHIRRAGIALENRPVATAELAAADVADGLAEHAPGPKVIASDGGVVNAGDGAELVDDSDSPRWIGPHTEYDKYGEPTGAHYLECSSCGVQVLSGRQETAYHTPDCRSRNE